WVFPGDQYEPGSMKRHLFHAVCPLALFTLLSLSACEPLPIQDDVVPVGVDAVVADSPEAPVGEGGSHLNWAGAPRMDGVKVVATRAGAVLAAPPGGGARASPAFRAPDGPRADGTLFGYEDVTGRVIPCAAPRQHNLAAEKALTLLRQ